MDVNRDATEHPWQMAFNNLDPALKSTIIAARGDKLDVLGSLLDEAERQKRLCIQRRWKIQWNGKSIILRDILDKIIAWVNRFKTVGDIAVQFDPVSSALPWAAVRFLLQAAVSDNHCYESTIHGIEAVSHMIVRYAAFEALYTQQESVIQTQLQTKLVGFYSQILTFLANSVNYFNQSTAKRMLKSVFQSTQEGELKEIADLDSEVDKLARLSDAWTQQKIYSGVEKIQSILESVQSPINRLVETSMIYAKTVEEQQFREFLKWLSPVPYSQHHDRHSEERIPNSNKWLFHHSLYISWRASSSSSLFLLHGIPGCGKTTLVSAVVDSFLSDERSNPLSVPLAYFYCGDAKFGRARADADEVMRSLARQLAVIDKMKRKIHEQILTDYQRRVALAEIDGFDLPQLRSSECADWILNILGQNPATIVIDGIDEVEEQGQHELLSSLIRIRDKSASAVKIFLSSRDNSSIFAHLPDAMMLRIQEAETQHDMKLFVRHRVCTAISSKLLLNGDVPENLQEKLVQFLSDRAGEMFLWVNLQMESLCRLKLKSSLSKAMQECSRGTPATIKQLYSEILLNISEMDSFAYSIAKRAFSWLMCMHESLSSEAFLAAVLMSDSDERVELTLPELLAICSNLVVLDTKLDVVRFAHFSFKEYLEEREEYDKPRANAVAAMSCLDACISNIYDAPNDISLQLHPDKEFQLYATMYWARHYQSTAVNDLSEDSHLASKLKEFAFYEDGETALPFCAWLDTVQVISALLANHHVLKKELDAVTSSNMTPLFMACVYGNEDLLSDVVKRVDFDVNERNLLEHTAIYLAAASGHHQIVKRLLNLGADTNIKCGKHGNSLCAAAFGGHIAVVKLLLVSAADFQSAKALESALQISCLAGHEDVAKLVLESGLEISSQKHYDAILQATSQAGFFEITRDLGRRFPSFSRTALSSSIVCDAAISKGQLSFLTRYLKNNPLPEHALTTAALFGQTQIALFCLDEGLDIQKEGQFGTPLRTASLMGHESIVRVLLERGADVNSGGQLGDALQASAMKGFISISKLLIRNNANVNNCSGYYGTPLQAAAYRGHYAVAEALLDAGAQISYPGRYKDAFEAAAAAGQAKVLSLFEARGHQGRSLDPPTFFSGSDSDLFTRSELYRDLMREASPSRTIYHVHDYGIQQDKGIEIQLESAVSDFEDIFRSVQPIAGSKTESSHAHIQSLENSGNKSKAKINSVDLIQSIVKNSTKLGLEKHDIGWTLWLASETGNTTLVEAIIGTRMDLRGFIQGALERVAWHGYMTILERLIKYVETWGSEGNIRLSVFENYWSAQNMYWPAGRSPMESLLQQNTDAAIHTRASRLFIPHQTKSLEKITNKLALSVILSGCRGDKPSIVRRGLELVTSVEIEELRGIALHEAAAFNSVGVIEALYQGRHAFKPHTFSLSFLAAAKHGAKSALALIAENDHGKDIWDGIYYEALELAVRNRHESVMQYLIENGPEIDILRALQELFVNAACEGDLSTLKFLIPEVQTWKSYRKTLNQALNEACAIGHCSVVELLIDARADVNAPVQKLHHIYYRNYGAAYPSVERGEWPRTALQTCFQAIPEFTEKTCFSLSGVRQFRAKQAEAIMKHEPVIKLLLDKGADVNQIAGGKRTPFQSAVLNCTEGTVRAMIEHGANIHDHVPGGATLLQYAASREIGSLPVFTALLEAGAEISTSEEADGGLSSPVLDAALSYFGPEPTTAATGMIETQSRPGRVTSDHMYSIQPEYVEEYLTTGQQLGSTAAGHGCFIQSETIEELFTSGPAAIIKTILQSISELRVNDTRFNLLLQMAAAIGDKDCIQLLVNRGVDVNLSGQYFGSALQAAARFGRLDCVHILLEAGANVNLVNGVHETPLKTAIKGAHAGVVHALINRGADVNHRLETSDPEPVGYNPFSLLKKHHSSPPIKLAVASKSPEATKMLINLDANVNHRLETSDPEPGWYNPWSPLKKRYSAPPIELAVASTSLEVTKILIDAGAELSHDLQLLQSPVQSGDVNLAGVLLDAGADVNEDIPHQSSILVKACGRGSVEMVKLLLSHGADVNYARETRPIQGEYLHSDDASPLIKACAAGLSDIVQCLLESGAEPDQRIEGCITPLAIAAKMGNLSIVEQLLKAGATIYDPSKSRNILYELRQEWTPKASLDFLLKNLSGLGRVVSACEEALSAAKDCRGEEWFITLVNEVPKKLTHLYQACRLGSKEAVESILAHGVDVNGDLKDGTRALHIAAYHQKTALVLFLISKGSDIELVSSQHGTPTCAAVGGLLATILSPRSWSSLQLPTSESQALSEKLRIATAPSNDPYNIHPLAYIDQKNNEPCEAIVRILLNCGALLNPSSELHGEPLLHLVCYAGSFHLAQVFLDRGLEKNITGGYFGSSLLAAMFGRHHGIINLLLDRGIDTNILSPKHGTALHYACRINDSEMIRTLLDHGADVNAYGSNNESPLAALLSYKESGNSSNPYLYGRETSYDMLWFPIKSSLDLLIHRDNLQIRTEDLPLVLAHSDCSREPVMRRILENKTARVTQDIVVLAASGKVYSSFESMVSLLLEYADFEVTPDMLKSAARPEHLRQLVQYRPRCKISPELLELLVQDKRHCDSYLQIVLEQEPGLVPTEAVFIALLSSYKNPVWPIEARELLTVLFDRSPSKKVTESMITAARYPGELNFLLSRGFDFPINEEMMESAASKPEGAELLRVCLNHDKTLKIGPGILNNCVTSSIIPCLELLHEQSPEFEISEDYILDHLRRLFPKDDGFHDADWFIRRQFASSIFTPQILDIIKRQEKV